MKTMIAFAALIAMSGVALAQQPATVSGMTGALKSGGGGNNSPLKDTLGLEGKGGVASYVSGSKSVLGTTGVGGWGNVGSTLTGGQVSSRPAK